MDTDGKLSAKESIGNSNSDIIHNYDNQSSPMSSTSSKQLYSQVIIARNRQLSRFGETSKLNSSMASKEFERYCRLDKDSKELFESIIDNKNMSLRSATRLLSVSRTIADMDDSDAIELSHLTEAFSYRYPEILLQ
jgi:magnesium chelatase family protein